MLYTIDHGEPTWWRRHRRMIADLATRDGHRVQHIMPNGSPSPHRASGWLTAILTRGSDIRRGQRVRFERGG